MHPSGGSDGAPSWAVLDDGKPGCAMYGIDELNPAESAAFANFWQNAPVAGPQGQAPGTGLQDHYIGALRGVRAPVRGHARRPGLRAHERAAARLNRLDARRQRVPGEQP